MIRRFLILLACIVIVLASEPLCVYAGAAGSDQEQSAPAEQDAPAEEEEEPADALTVPFGITKGKLFQEVWDYISGNWAKLTKPAATGRTPNTVLRRRFDKLSVYLDKKMEEWNGSEKWAVTVIVEDGNLSGSFGCGEPMTAASLIKLYIAGECMKENEVKRFPESTLREMDLMINCSDNDACNYLIGLLTMDRINGFIQEKGFEDTVLRRRMLEARTGSNENMTSVRNCGEVLHQILTGTYVSAEASARILQDMKDQERRNKIPSGLPEGVVSANKTGELLDVENDVAIIWGESCTYILCVMSENVQPGRAQSRIRELSSQVYQILNND